MSVVSRAETRCCLCNCAAEVPAYDLAGDERTRVRFPLLAIFKTWNILNSATESGSAIHGR